MFYFLLINLNQINLTAVSFGGGSGQRISTEVSGGFLNFCLWIPKITKKSSNCRAPACCLRLHRHQQETAVPRDVNLAFLRISKLRRNKTTNEQLEKNQKCCFLLKQTLSGIIVNERPGCSYVRKFLQPH